MLIVETRGPSQAERQFSFNSLFEMSVLWGRRRRTAAKALQLSILYLRCQTTGCRSTATLELWPFNSLFEMSKHFEDRRRRLRHISFNSLFEMRPRGSGTLGEAGPKCLSILYLRCSTYEQTGKDGAHIPPFNSLFEMPAVGGGVGLGSYLALSFQFSI